jgi:signal transduction histidine kinase/DNA-binding response OmpR family regulator
MNMRPYFSSIRARLLGATLVPIFILGLVVGGYMIYIQRAVLFDNMHHMGRDKVHQIATNAALASALGERLHMEALASRLLETIGKSYTASDTVGGLIVYNAPANRLLRIGDISLTPETMPVDFDSGEPFRLDDHWYYYAAIYLDEPSVLLEEPLSTSKGASIGWVVISLTNEVFLARQRDRIIAAVVATILSFILTLWLSVRLGHSVVKPVESLTRHIREIELDTNRQLALEEGPIEIQKLAQGIHKLQLSVAESKTYLKSKIAAATSQLQATLIDLEEAMKVKDQFLARMSHELRTPLTAVIGFSTLVSKEKDAAKRKEHARVVVMASTMLLTMIDDILEFSKAGVSGFTLEKMSWNAREGAVDILAVHQPSADEKGIALSFNIHPTVPEFLLGDPVRLAQIISNLVSNAMKFTDRGFVTIDAESEVLEGDSILMKLTVSDSGKGIADNKIPFLFDPFSQEDTSINRRFGGTGLGLAISKRLVEAMGGDIKVESTLGVGTVISFTCKLLQTESITLSSDHENRELLASEILSGITILLAEDNTFNQKLFVRLLKGYGANCLVANNGLEAIEIAGNLHVDVVLLDIHMPLVDGVTACAAIVQQSGEAPPVIGLTADITLAEHQHMLDAGAVSVQLKPVDEAKLVRSILSALNSVSEATDNTSGGILSSVIPVDELKSALYQNLDSLLAKLRTEETGSQRQIMHDLLGLSGLYGMGDLRELVLQFKASYAGRNLEQRIESVAKIRAHIEGYLVPDDINS